MQAAEAFLRSSWPAGGRGRERSQRRPDPVLPSAGRGMAADRARCQGQYLDRRAGRADAVLAAGAGRSGRVPDPLGPGGVGYPTARASPTSVCGSIPTIVPRCRRGASGGTRTPSSGRARTRRGSRCIVSACPGRGSRPAGRGASGSAPFLAMGDLVLTGDVQSLAEYILDLYVQEEWMYVHVWGEVQDVGEVQTPASRGLGTGRGDLLVGRDPAARGPGYAGHRRWPHDPTARPAGRPGRRHAGLRVGWAGGRPPGMARDPGDEHCRAAAGAKGTERIRSSTVDRGAGGPGLPGPAAERAPAGALGRPHSDARDIAPCSRCGAFEGTAIRERRSSSMCRPWQRRTWRTSLSKPISVWDVPSKDVPDLVATVLLGLDRVQPKVFPDQGLPRPEPGIWRSPQSTL